MRKISRITAALAMVSSTTAATAADRQNCMPAAEAEALMIFVLPSALSAVSKKCSATLAADAPLLQLQSPRMIDYKTKSEAAWPMAQDALRSFVGDSLPDGIDIGTLRPFAEAMIASKISEDVKIKDCDMINRFYELLEPMPASNLASIFTLILSSDSPKRRSSSPSICKPVSE